MTSTEHWAIKYIGEKYVTGENDCWQFFRKIQMQEYNRFVDEIPVDVDNIRSVMHETKSKNNLSKWKEVKSPEDGDGILLGSGKRPTHIGVCVEINGKIGVLHALKGIGVVYTPLDRLIQSGWSKKWIYRYAVDR